MRRKTTVAVQSSGTILNVLAARVMALTALMLALTAPWTVQFVAAAPDFTIWTVGNEADAQSDPRGGIALMDGGPDVDDAFRWMLSQSHGGDVVVIRTPGGDGYNEYIAGSDQAEYLRFWKDTPLEAAITTRVAEGMTIGGSSAGAVVLGGHIHSAARGSVTSRVALRTPYDRRVTFASGFLALPGLDSVVIDSHVGERHREGRLVAFMARLAKHSRLPVRGIGLDEGTAVVIDADGDAMVLGSGGALILEGSHPPQRCTRKKPLTYRSLTGFIAEENDAFDTVTWNGEGIESVVVSAVRRSLRMENVDP